MPFHAHYEMKYLLSPTFYQGVPYFGTFPPFWDISNFLWTFWKTTVNKRVISLYSVGMRENTDQKNFEYRHFSRSVEGKEKRKKILYIDGESSTLIVIGNRKLFIQLLLNSFSFFFYQLNCSFLISSKFIRCIENIKYCIKCHINISNPLCSKFIEVQTQHYVNKFTHEPINLL